jgi:hypothetical protein
MNRLLLVNLTRAPERAELTTTERAVGDRFLEGLSGVEYAGYITIPGVMKLGAQWLVEDSEVPTVAARVRNTAVADGYDFQLFVGRSDGGTVRVI